MTAKSLNATSTLIVGMGQTGISCARYLSDRGTPFRMIDSRDNPPMLDQVRQEFASNELYTGAFVESQLHNIEQIIISPGVALSHPFIQLAQQRGIEVIGDVELFARHVNAPVIAITGSNGKSTVTTLVGEMLNGVGVKAYVGGNIGTPVLDLLAKPKPDVYVLELSSFQLETTTSLAPRAAAVLNVSDDHMDRYPDIAAYAESKARIYNNAACCIVNCDDVIVRAMQSAVNSTCLGFTLDVPAANEFGLKEIEGETWLAHGDNALLPSKDLQLIGDHNVANALAALALIDAFSIAPEQTLTVLPFILRAVCLLGINSVDTPRDLRLAVWQRIGADLKPRHLDKIAANTITFDELPGAFQAFIDGKVTGRTVVEIA